MSVKSMIVSAMQYLSLGTCSEFSLRLLLEQEYEAEPNLQSRIHEVLAYLHELGLINDTRVARLIAERYSHKGDTIINQYLDALGIDEEHGKKAIAFIGSEYCRALREVQIRQSNWEEKDPEKLRIRIIHFLKSRSFSYTTQNQVISALFEPDIEAPINKTEIYSLTCLIPLMGYIMQEKKVNFFR